MEKDAILTGVVHKFGCGVLGGDGDVARPGSNARGQGASPKYREESLDEDETVADLEERTAGKVGGNKHM